MGEGTCPPREGRGRTLKGEGAVSFRENGPGLNTERRSSVVGRKSSRRENKISCNGGQKRKIERI